MSQPEGQQIEEERARASAEMGMRGSSAPGEYSFAASGAGNLVQVLNKSDLPEDVRRMIEPELNPDHILGNLSEAEIRYRRFQIKNNKEMVMASFPPEESLWQGETRKEVFAGDGRSALTQEQVHGIRDAFDAAFARISRSRGGWQQKILAEQTQERRIVEDREDESSGGPFSGILWGR